MDILRPKPLDFNDLIYRPQVRRKAPHIAPPAGKKYCIECEKYRKTELFTSKTGRLYTYCQECRNRKQRESYTPDRGRKSNLRKMYSLTQEEYDLMLFQQGEVCALCRQPETLVNAKTGQLQPLSVDHDHTTGVVRALLCNNCNHLLGFLEQNRELAKKALLYLHRFDM